MLKIRIAMRDMLASAGIIGRHRYGVRGVASTRPPGYVARHGAGVSVADTLTAAASRGRHMAVAA